MGLSCDTRLPQVEDSLRLRGLLRERPVVELEEHAGVDSGQFLHGEVDVVEAVFQATQQQFGHTWGDRRGFAGLCQLSKVQPLAAQTLLSAEVNVVGEGAEAADEVHVRHSERSGMVVLLPDTEQRLELRADARLLVDLPNCSRTWEWYNGKRKRLMLLLCCT